MIDQRDWMSVLEKYRGDAVVIPAYQAVKGWAEVSRLPRRDFSIDCPSMGKFSSIALGFALARSDTRVILMDGDGSLLMNLGTWSPSRPRRPRTSTTSSYRTASTPPPAGRLYPPSTGSPSRAWPELRDTPPPTPSTTWRSSPTTLDASSPNRVPRWCAWRRPPNPRGPPRPPSPGTGLSRRSSASCRKS